MLEKQAKESADELRTFVITLPEQFKHLPESTKARIAELQKQANELIAHATSTYSDFAGLGKEAVDEAVDSARKLSSKAEKRADETGADVAESGADLAETVTPPSTAEASARQPRRLLMSPRLSPPPSTAEASAPPETVADVTETVTPPSQRRRPRPRRHGETPAKKAAASADN